MLILSSFSNKKYKMKTPRNKDNLNLINFTSPQKPILNLETINNNYNNIKSSKNNKNLFIKIKKLITEFEQEKNEKEKLHRFKPKKNKTKSKSKSNKNKKSKKIPKQIVKTKDSIFIPNKKVYFSVPKIKSQMQFNRYLINDFKENDSEMDYIKRSLKYQKINEDFDELVFLKQVKEVAKNGILQNVMEDNQKNELDFFESPDSEGKSNNSFKKHLSKNISEFSINNVLKNNNLYNTNIRRLYTEKIKIIPKSLGKNENRRGSINYNFNYQNYINQTSRTKVSEKENSFNEEKENINNNERLKDNNKSPGIKLLMEMKNKNKNNETKQKKKKITSPIDKYKFSNKLYNASMNEYNRYKRKKQYMRGKNFSKQIALINKEKEKLGIIETENDDDEPKTERGLPKLMIPNLLFHIEYKDIFKNSFNTLRVFEEGDQDLDLDDLNKIKKSIKDYEVEMIKVLKQNNNLNYIKKRFNKTTVGKFQSTKGIYFGS